MDESTVQETVDYIAIQRVQAAYADAVNRRAWPEFESIFAPDAVVTIDRRVGTTLELNGPRAVGDFIGAAIERFDFFEFVILNVTMTLQARGDPDVAAGRMYMCELRHERENGQRTTAFGVYHDRYARTDGRWRIAHRTYHSIARTGHELDVFGFPETLSAFLA
ncbi:MAG TPA: nuclear transport factor 2 family protein [Acidimicrobiales bacterium]|jgi:ketosteroid isomerase-like protein|nr:nuclear transport factor 2 family protein [Acidimicrobiales bacterium]